MHGHILIKPQVLDVGGTSGLTCWNQPLEGHKTSTDVEGTGAQMRTMTVPFRLPKNSKPIIQQKPELNPVNSASQCPSECEACQAWQGSGRQGHYAAIQSSNVHPLQQVTQRALQWRPVESN